MSDPPAVSVIVPARDAAATLAGALASLASQTDPDWEALVVDDGSRDGTRALADAAAAADPRIRVLDGPGEGAGPARNVALAAARAPLVMFLDADDALEPEALEVLRPALDDPAVDVAHGGWVRLFGDHGRGPAEFGPSGADLFVVFASHCGFTIHAALSRRRAIEAAGGFDPAVRLAEDWDLWQRMARGGARFARVDRVVAVYTMRPDSSSRDAGAIAAISAEVIARGHAPDPRVDAPRPEHARGRPAGEALAATLMIWIYWAAEHAETPAEVAAILARMRLPPGLRADPADLGDTVLDALLVADTSTRRGRHEVMVRYARVVDMLMDAATAATGDLTLAPRARRRMEDRVATDPLTPTPARIGTSWIGEWDLERPPPASPPDALRAILRVHLGGEAMETLTLPVVDGVLAPEVVVDALGDETVWTLLERALARWDADAPAEADPWTRFLRETWDRPGWSPRRFYPERARPAHTPPADVVEAIDVADGPPHGHRPARWVDLSVGSRPLARVAVGEGGADDAVADLTDATGFELCRAVVRAAIVGRPFDAEPRSVRGRLAAAAGRPVAPADPSVLVLPRRAAPPGGPAWRRARLPRSVADVAAAGAGVVAPSRPPGAVEYRPDVIDARGAGVPPRPPGPPGSDPAARRRDAREVAAVLRADGPHAAPPHAAHRHAQILEIAGSLPAGRALEIGCGDGWLTLPLAACVTSLVATDISSVALGRCRARLREAAVEGVELARLDVALDPLPPGGFDLIVADEALPGLVDHADLPRVLARLAGALRPGGRLVCAHTLARADDPAGTGFDAGAPYGALAVGRALAATRRLAVETELRTPLHLIHVARRAGALRRRPAPRVVEGDALWPVGAEADLLRAAGDPAPPLPSRDAAAPARVAILCYHRCAPTGKPRARRFRVTPETLDEHLAAIAELDLPVIGLDEWAAALGARMPPQRRSVVLTFDDAYVDFAEHALPILERHGTPVTLFVPTGRVGGTSAWDAVSSAAAPIMDWDGVAEVAARGVAIGAHSVSHRPMTGLTNEEVVVEVARSRAALEDRLGSPIRMFSYPYGDNDPVVRNLAGAAGIDVAVTIDRRTSRVGDDPLALPRIEVVGDESTDTLIDLLLR